MTSTYTSALALEIPGHGDYATTGWDSPMNASLRQLDVAYGQTLGLTAAGSNFILTTAQASYPVVFVSGTLTGNVIITYPPNVSGRRIIIPACDMKSFALYVRGNNGVDQIGVYFWQGFGIPYGIVVTGGSSGRVYWDYGGAQPGTVMDMMTGFPGNGWLPCDGRYVSSTAHDLLYDILGLTYDPHAPSGTFKLPDLRGSVLAMADNLGLVPAAPQALGQNMGNAGRLNSWGLFGGLGPQGEANHGLLINELPAHTHADTTGHTHTATEVAHNHTYGELVPGTGPYGAGLQASTVTATTGTAQPTISVTPASVTVNNTGGNAAHNNVQPTVCTMKMIKW